MRVLLPLTTFIAAASAQSGPVLGESNTWYVDYFEAGCARSGCYFYMNVSSPGVKDRVPAFEADCSNLDGEGSPFRQCHVLASVPGATVAARLESQPDSGNKTGAHLAVSYAFQDLKRPGIRWNYTAKANPKYNAFVSPPQNFTMYPEEVFAVA